MPYRFATERPDYTDLSSGRVLHSLPGYPAFPIRLASEMFQRCLARLPDDRLTTPCGVYDPCCGTGYLLSVVAFLHWEQISTVMGSDIDAQAVSLAERNLALLSPAGLDQRITELDVLFNRYGKKSHQEALESAQRLRQKVLAQPRPIFTQVFQADVTDSAGLAAGLSGKKIDIVLTDVPYGQHSQWQFTRSAPADPVWAILEALRGVLAPAGIVAVASAKRQKAAHEAYQRIEHFQIGKRQVIILQARHLD